MPEWLSMDGWGRADGDGRASVWPRETGFAADGRKVVAQPRSTGAEWGIGTIYAPKMATITFRSHRAAHPRGAKCSRAWHVLPFQSISRALDKHLPRTQHARTAHAA